MGGTSEKRDGRRYPTEDLETGTEITVGEIDRMGFARAGFQVPRPNTVLDAARFWQLTGEGWRFVVGEDGAIVACLPPPLSKRLEALTDTENAKRKPGKKRGKS